MSSLTKPRTFVRKVLRNRDVDGIHALIDRMNTERRGLARNHISVSETFYRPVRMAPSAAVLPANTCTMAHR